MSGFNIPTILSCNPRSISISVEDKLFVITRSGAFSNTCDISLPSASYVVTVTGYVVSLASAVLSDLLCAAVLSTVVKACSVEALSFVVLVLPHPTIASAIQVVKVKFRIFFIIFSFHFKYIQSWLGCRQSMIFYNLLHIHLSLNFLLQFVSVYPRTLFHLLS